jgi:hypothetical protein
MTDWPRSILPGDRDVRWHWLLDATCVLYRKLWDGEEIVSMTVTVRGKDGSEREIRYPGAIELEVDRDEASGEVA